MIPSLFLDPLQMWRDAINRLEGEANTLATGSLKSPELVRSLQQATAVSAGMQQGFDKMVDGYLRRANLPSRKQLAELVQTLERIEQKLDRLLPPDEVPRPARTRKPAATPVVAPSAPAAPAQAAPEAVAPAPKANQDASAKTKAKPAKTAKTASRSRRPAKA